MRRSLERWTAAAAAAGVAAWVIALTVTDGWWDRPEEKGWAVAILLGAYAVAWALLGVVAWRVGRGVGGPGPSPLTPLEAQDRRVEGGRERVAWVTSGMVILLVASAARVAVVGATQPRLSDDIWRYLLDGATLAAGENPYRWTPRELQPLMMVLHAPPVNEGIWDVERFYLAEKVNNPDLHTIYQPASQWIFGSAWRWHTLLHDVLSDYSYPLPVTAPVTFRLIFGGVDLLIIALLLRRLERANLSAWWAALYAWHPLAIVEVAGSGHQEPIGMVGVVAAVMLWEGVGDGARHGHTAESVEPGPAPLAELAAHNRRVETTTEGKEGRGKWAYAAGAGACLAWAVAVKPVVLPLAAVLAGWLVARHGRRAWWSIASATVAGAATLCAVYLPFVIVPGGIDGMLETASTFVATWASNGSIHSLLAELVGRTAAGIAAGAGLLAVIVYAAWQAGRLALWSACVTVLLAQLLLSSTVHPWYALWPLALLPIAWGERRSGVGPVVCGTLWVFAGVLPLAYTAFVNPVEFQPLGWAVAVEYAAVYGTLIVLGLRTWRYHTPPSIAGSD